jgi:hypothetical protein
MATIKLVSPDTGAVYWRAALESVKGVSGQPINEVIKIDLLKANYYKVAVEEMDGESAVIKKFPLYEEYMTVYGDYQINAQTGEFSQIS